MSAPLDQHFLVDGKAVERICRTVEVAGRVVLEIGPGRGCLTRCLLDSGARVFAVEIDRELVELLSCEFSREISGGRLTILHGDAVRCVLPPFEVAVSNLPYSASSKITFRLLETGFQEAVLMYQSEFAKRMAASPGTSGCGRLSIMVQTYCSVQRLFDLPPRCFSPPPKVHSTVVRIVPRGPLFPISDRELYSEVVRALFSHRRKTVRNGLKSAGGMLPPGAAERMLAALPEEILSSRPEALYLEDFAAITSAGCP